MIEKADSLFKQYKFIEAAKIYLELADKSTEVIHKIEFIRKAAMAFHELGSYNEEAECMLQTCPLLEEEEKIECLVSVWRIYIMAIAVFQYERSFEWRGEAENLDEAYFETIEGYFEKAVAVLKGTLRQKGIDRDMLLERLGNECAKRQNEDGWAADHCRKSIEKAWKK